MGGLTIGKRMGLAFGFLMLCLAGLSVLGVLTMVRVNRGIVDADEEYLPVSQMAGNFERALLNARIHFAYYLTIQKPGSLENGTAKWVEAKTILAKLEERLQTTKLNEELQPLVQKLHRDIQDYEATKQLVTESIANNQWTDPRKTELTTRWAATGAALIATTGKIQDVATSRTAVTMDESADALRKGIQWTFAVALITMALAGGLSGWMVRQINRVLRRVVSSLAVGGNEVAGAAQQVSASSESMARGASTQAASLEETSASMSEIGAMSNRNSEGANRASQLMNAAEKKFTEASGALQGAVAAMTEINSHSDRISRIIKVIDDIAFQTNILALNAAVEAARAGEAGMGFAVVAEEVRNLAQRSAQAASDTAKLIEESILKSGEGKTRVDQVAAAIQAVKQPLSEVKDLVTEVALGSMEQTRGTEQVSQAVVQLEGVTQTSAANAEECAAAAEELKAQSENLQNIVTELTVLVGA